MEINKVNPSFKSLKIGRLPAIARIYIPPYEEMEKLTKNADVYIKSCENFFPYEKYGLKRMWCQALKISARPKNLSFFKRLFNKNTVTEYFPIGNLRESVIYDKSKTVAGIIAELVSKVQ